MRLSKKKSLMLVLVTGLKTKVMSKALKLNIHIYPITGHMVVHLILVHVLTLLDKITSLISS